MQRSLTNLILSHSVQIGTGWPLVTKLTPLGIVDLELAKTVSRTEQILSVAWENMVWLPVVNILFDFWFIVAYVQFYLVLLTFIQQKHSDDDKMLGHHFWLVTAVWVAGVSDGMENIALLSQLASAPHPIPALFSYCLAILKFTLLGAVTAYILLDTVIGCLTRNSRFIRTPKQKAHAEILKAKQKNIVIDVRSSSN